MPVYEYQGKHYELSETDPIKAKERIVSSVGGVPKTEEKGFLSKAGDVITGAAKALTTGVDLTKVITKPETLTTKVSEKIGAPVVKDVSFDPSKMKAPEPEAYLERAGQRGLEGLMGGTAFAPFTGKGGIIAGGLGGVAQGLIEQAASDLGLSADLQQAAGVVGPAAAGYALAKSIPNTPQQRNQILSSEATDKLKSKLAQKAFGKALGLPSWSTGILEKPIEMYKQSRPIDVKAASAEIGATPETLGVGGTKFQDKANIQLSKQHPDIQVPTGERFSTPLYEKAKTDYTGTMRKENFINSPEFKSATGGVPAEETKFAQVFQNEKGQPLTGEDVVNNLQFNKLNLSTKDLNKARSAFNDFLERNTGKRQEEIARGAFETESVARAKDKLPGLFESNRPDLINKELWNLSKSEEGIKIFNSEMLNFFKNNNAKNARKMWAQIGPNVRQTMKVPQDKYDRITAIINGAKTQKDVSRATRILQGVVAPMTVRASETISTEQE